LTQGSKTMTRTVISPVNRDQVTQNVKYRYNGKLMTNLYYFNDVRYFKVTKINSKFIFKSKAKLFYF